MKTLSLIAVVALSLLSGCNSNSCLSSCEKDYEACIDDGGSDDECGLVRSRCEDACAEESEESSE